MSKKCQISKSRISPGITRNAVTTSPFMFIPVLAAIFPRYRQPRNWHVFFIFRNLILRFGNNIKNLLNFRTLPNFFYRNSDFSKIFEISIFLCFWKKIENFLKIFLLKFQTGSYKANKQFQA